MCETNHGVMVGQVWWCTWGRGSAVTWQMESVPCQKGQPQSVVTFPTMWHEEHVEHSSSWCQSPRAREGKQGEWVRPRLEWEGGRSLCVCHAQCMSHERCAPRSNKNEIIPGTILGKSFLSAFPGDGLCKDLVLATYSSCLLSSCSWCPQGLGHDPPRPVITRITFLPKSR